MVTPSCFRDMYTLKATQSGFSTPIMLHRITEGSPEVHEETQDVCRLSLTRTTESMRVTLSPLFTVLGSDSSKSSVVKTGSPESRTDRKRVRDDGKKVTQLSYDVRAASHPD